MKTVNGNFNDVMIVWELRGSYPDISTFEGIDIAELTKGDDSPVFLTLPIGEVNSKSGNGRYYDDKWLAELERQVKANRPIGIMGHLREEDLGTQFPTEAIHWVGTQRVNEILWGKGYVPPGEARERVRRYKATNKNLATSIFAKAQGVWDAGVNAYRMAADSMQLHQIDIGPADRVGIPSLARVPVLTAEMQTESEEIEGESPMDKLTVINEMTAEDARLLPKTVQDAIIATVPAAPEIGLVSELCAALGTEPDKLTALITEMQAKQQADAKTAVDNHITQLVNDGIKIETVRGIVTELVTSRHPATIDEAATAYGAVVEMESVKQLLATAVKAEMGPNHQTPAQPANGQSKYFAIPKEN